MASFWHDYTTAPRTGWVLDSTGDLGRDPKNHIVCEACGEQRVRYHHRVHHPAIGAHLEVGCECADLMCAVPRAAAAAAQMRNRAARLNNFPHLLGWTETRAGNMRLKKDGWIFVETRTKFESYAYSYVDALARKAEWQRVPGFFKTQEEGRRAAFTHVYPAEIQHSKRLILR
jgi:hypothetical protein